jgi:hypothetical protein
MRLYTLPRSGRFKLGQVRETHAMRLYVMKEGVKGLKNAAPSGSWVRHLLACNALTSRWWERAVRG